MSEQYTGRVYVVDRLFPPPLLGVGHEVQLTVWAAGLRRPVEPPKCEAWDRWRKEFGVWFPVAETPRAVRMHQDFKFNFVARWDQSVSQHTVTDREIAVWVATEAWTEGAR